MRCHYEVLGVTLNATIDEIKKAYKKAALQWHPDKHSANKEEANKRFLEIQDAYETLSNEQDRAWYDSHREVLINGGVPSEENESNFIFNIYPYFSSSCFRGFGDDENGFFSVFADVFAKIAEEDRPHYDDDSIDIPMFGKSDSDYDEVVAPFYAFWLSYCTPRSFVWIEKHDTREANDRYVRRLMEKENKKLKDKAKKERNEEIRKLVSFIRKKDPRVEQYKKQLEERSALAQKKAQEKREAERLKRAEQMKNYVEPEWCAVNYGVDAEEELKSKYEGNRQNKIDTDAQDATAAADDEDEDEDEFDDSLFCVACDKSFKSAKSFANHEKSKKHKENLQLLKLHMKEEDENFFHDKSSTRESDEPEETEPTELRKQNENERNNNRLSKKQKKKKRKNNIINLKAGDESSNDENDDDLDNNDVQETAAEHETAGNHQVEESASLSDEKNSKEEDKEEESIRETKQDEQEENDISSSAAVPDNLDEINDTTKKSAASLKSKQKQQQQKQTFPVVLLKCSVCEAEFDTRNKLFDHIKAEGHAAPKLLIQKQQLELAQESTNEPLSHNAIKKNRRLAKQLEKLNLEKLKK